jgi:hypothetical protein
MLVFVMALQSPAVSRDWKRVAAMCERSLLSACRQTEPDFQVILVCNEKPPMTLQSPQLQIIEGDFAAPRTATERMSDKWTKLRQGCVVARAFAPCHIMLMDADDMVSRRLAAFCARQPDNSGWLMRRGYVHEEGSRWLLRRENFHLLCGSSCIVHCTPDELPSHAKENSDRFLVLNQGHTVIEQAFQGLGRPLLDLPFEGAVYEVGTGENDSGFSLKKWPGKKEFLRRLVNLRLLTPGLRAEFGIHNLTSA